MRRTIFLALAGVLLSVCAQAQAPKWVEKAKRAVCTVIAYDADGQILSKGNAFFVSPDGQAVSGCRVFKDAHHAVVLDYAGNTFEVNSILGADELYDVLKFHVDKAGKKSDFLHLSDGAPADGAEVYLLPYQTKKERRARKGLIDESAPMKENYHYFTLKMPFEDLLVNCPLLTADGELFGMAQASFESTDSICYGLSASYARDLNIGLFSLNDPLLNSIAIPKALPSDLDQALIYLYMASTQVPAADYLRMLETFIATYPKNSEGYLRRAAALMPGAVNADDYERVEADMEKAYKVSESKADVCYNLSKLMLGYQSLKMEKKNAVWNVTRAKELVDEAISLDSIPLYTLLKADILLQEKSYGDALACYEVVNRSNLATPATFFNAAQAKEELKADPKEVLALMDSCIAHCSAVPTEEEAPYFLERAGLHMQAREFRLALHDYDSYYKAVRGEVNDVFYYYREQAAIPARQYQRALDDLDRAIELNPDEVLYQAERAVVNLRVGRHEQALKGLQELVARHPDYAEGYRLMGLCYVQMKNSEAAVAQFEKAVSLGDEASKGLLKKYSK